MIRIPGAEALSEEFARTNAKTVTSHLREHYGVETKAIKRLATEKDDTFVVRSTTDEKFLIKIDSPFEEEGLADFLSYVINTVSHNDPELPIQRMIHALDGSSVTQILVETRPRPFRALTYLDGQLIGTQRPVSNVLITLGSMQARIQNALIGVTHPGQDRHGRLMWEMRALPLFRPIVAEVSDKSLHTKINTFIDHFEFDVIPVLMAQPAQIVHNDFNLSNLLLSSDREQVVGVLDFGDATHTQVISDISVTLSSFFLMENSDGFSEAKDFFTGYLSERNLSESEIDLVGELITARVVITVLLATWTSKIHTENYDYLSRYIDIATPTCHRVLDLGPDAITDRIRLTIATDGIEPHVLPTQRNKK